MPVLRNLAWNILADSRQADNPSKSLIQNNMHQYRCVFYVLAHDYPIAGLFGFSRGIASVSVGTERGLPVQ